MGLSADIVKFTEIMQSWITKTQSIFFSNTASDIDVKMLNSSGDIEVVQIPNYKKIHDTFDIWKNSINVKNVAGNVVSDIGEALSIDKFGGLTLIQYKALFQSLVDDNFVSIVPTGTTTGMTPYQNLAFVTRSNKLKSIGYNLSGIYFNGTGTIPQCTMDLEQPYSKKDNKIVKLWNSGFHMVILYDDGSLYGRGIQALGHFGLGNIANVLAFTLMNTDVVDYVVSSHGDNDESPSAKILKADGTVWACGNNGTGQMGINTVVNSYVWVKCYDPASYSGDLATKIYVEGSDSGYSFILTASGKLYAMGYNGVGQLGLNDLVNKNVITLVPTNIFDSPVAKVATGNYTDASYVGTTYVLTTSGRVYSTGANTNGTCSNGTIVNKSLFTEILYDASHNVLTDPVIKIFVSFHSAFILTASGKLYATGYNTCGQLGIGDVTLRNRMALVASNVKDFYSILGSDASDYPTNFITKTDGTLHVCGYNVHGECGIGTVANVLAWTLVPFVLADKIVDIFGSGYSNVNTPHLLLSDGSVYSTGNNVYGEVTGFTTAPVFVSHFVQTKL